MNAPVRFRVVFGALCIFLFLLFSALPVQAQTARSADFQVILFENPNFEGGSMGYTTTTNFPTSTGGIFPPVRNGTTGSVPGCGEKCPGILYQHAGFGGPSIIFEGDGSPPCLFLTCTASVGAIPFHRSDTDAHRPGPVRSPFLNT